MKFPFINRRFILDKEKLKKLERLFDNGLPTSILNQILLLNNPEINSKIDILLEDANLDKFSNLRLFSNAK